MPNYGTIDENDKSGNAQEKSQKGASKRCTNEGSPHLLGLSSPSGKREKSKWEKIIGSAG
eukprot:scaffold22492_cov138-Skeletonema_menzelii.AAC.8